MGELKCCPFCGGEVVISDEKIDATREVYNFHCHNCDMVTFYDFPNDKEKAIETWNTRAPMANIVEKLEEAEKKGSELIGKPHMDSHVLFGWGCAMKTAIEIVREEGDKNDRS